MRESGAPVRPVSLTAAFNVAHRFDNLAAADSHQVHAAHGIGLTRTPEITPSDYRAIAGHEYRTSWGEPLRMTFSVGVATSSPTSMTADDLFRSADRALYLSKQNGRNRATQAI